jgi:hypothetical protein
LTATATGGHVLPATVYSKSVLRAVAGDLASNYDNIDYFPSYEIVTNQAARSEFFEANFRSIKPEGIASVMNVFFSEFDAESKPRIVQSVGETGSPDQLYEAALLEEKLICEDELLEKHSR